MAANTSEDRKGTVPADQHISPSCSAAVLSRALEIECVQMPNVLPYVCVMPDLSYHLQLEAMHALGKSDPHSFIILHAITHVRI